MGNLRVDIPGLSDRQLFDLASEARLLRVDPRKKWSKAEIREHARAGVIYLIKRELQKEDQ